MSIQVCPRVFSCAFDAHATGGRSVHRRPIVFGSSAGDPNAHGSRETERSAACSLCRARVSGAVAWREAAFAQFFLQKRAEIAMVALVRFA
jgi:hypothetical protein